MKFYQEITILPGPELPLNFLWSKVYQQLHLGFVETKDENGKTGVGVSFPQYSASEDGKGTLGSKLRLFAETREELERFGAGGRLERFSDYVHLTRIRPVPATVSQHSVYSRVREEATSHRKARRFAKRHPDISYEKALQLFEEGRKKENPKVPFVRLTSQTNGHSFSLCIDRKKAEEKVGRFGTYGLDDQTTVPEF